MHRTPYASLRVPDIDDTDQRQGLIDLATDIQFRTEWNAARLQELRRRRGALVEAPGSQALPNNTPTVIQYNDELYDTDGYVDLGVDNTKITIPRGLWMVTGYIFALTGSSLSFSVTDITGSVYGNITFQQPGPFAASVTSFSRSACSGLFYSTAGEDVTMNIYSSSGGAGTILSAALCVMKIGDL